MEKSKPPIKLLPKPLKPQPYQHDDFIKNEHGFPIAYRGPVYHLEYPSELNCDPLKELMDWDDLGYRTGAFYHGSDGVIGEVWGDIPKDFQKRLEQKGVVISLVKRRGEGHPIQL